ncbi:MAG: D-TA family PLP-dependent enzyme [Saprospiraceae bacterium]|nr:D-TA family PLP-dependent enzyme [Saprospiraceae bacterium]
MTYTIDDIDQLDSPALVIYPEGVRHNIDLAIRMIGDVQRLRPHVKTHKSADATRLMLDAGIRKFKCATIAEAEMLGMCGAPDVLLAYQPVGPKVQRFMAVMEKYPATRFSCLTDNLAAAQAMAVAFAARHLEVPVFIDLNIGQNRTGIAPEQAFELYTACAAMKGIAPVGFQAYDGHIRNSDLQARKTACDAAFLPVQTLQQTLVKAGYPEPVIIAGGSPTFSIHAARKQVECSPGTFIYWDKGYADLCPDQPFLPAALLVTRVVSLPDAGKLCFDLGHKSVAAENPIDHRIFFLNAPGLIPVGQSEEHLVVEAGEGHSWKIGDVLYGIPFHICPTVALHERAYAVENQKITGEWRAIARDRKITC